ncbi:hypothetical protein QUB68_06055 [Microcoleus sp. A006_D1]
MLKAHPTNPWTMLKAHPTNPWTMLKAHPTNPAFDCYSNRQDD